MKIGMSGAGGTGKSTTAVMLTEKLGLPLRPSPSRSVFAKLGITAEDDQNGMDFDLRWQLQTGIHYAIQDQIAEYSNGVYDRTTLDNFFYLISRCPETDAEDIEEFEKQMVAALRSFDLLLYFPTYKGWCYNTDGMRTASVANKMVADYCMQQLIMKHKLPYVFVPDGTPEYRLKYVIDTINNGRD